MGRYKWLWITMCSPLLAVIIYQLVTGDFRGRTFDLPSRLALFVFMLWAIMLVPLRALKLVKWAMATGAIAAAIKIYVLTNGGVLRYGTDFIPIITFGQMSLLMGVFCAYSLAWEDKPSRLHIAVMLVALSAGLLSAYVSQSRGVWATVPVFMVLAFSLLRHVPRKIKLWLVALFVVALGLISMFSGIFKERVMAVQTDLQEYASNTDVNTSLGLRLQLWKGSLVLFREHPLVGVGVENYPLALKDLAQRRIISEEASTYQHSHNEILFTMARLGIVGTLALLAVYFVPLGWFALNLRHMDPGVRTPATMGTALVLGFFVLGLADVVFLWWESFPFYAIGVALFVACIDKRKRERV